MVQSSVVFLIDINGIERAPGNINNGEESGQLDASHNDTMEMFPFRGEEVDEDPLKLQCDDLKWLKDFVLLTLFKEANNGTDYDFGKVQWAFKFYDSTRHVDYRDGRQFMPFDYESFTSFEKQLDQRMGPSSVDIKNRADSEVEFHCPNIKFLTDALKIITGSLAWTEQQDSSNLSRSFNGESKNARNLVFACLKVPRTENEILDFTDLQSISSSKDFMSVLLPSAFSAKFHHAFKIQLNFVDLRTSYDNNTLGIKSEKELERKWNVEYPRHLGKCLQYLGGGRVLPMPNFPKLRDESLKFGLVPYQIYLKSRLQQASQQNENLPSHIQRLAPKKISPDLDTSSVNRSMKSGGASLLEASYSNSHNHSKLLRPFRMSAGYDSEEMFEYHRELVAGIKPLDRAREVERKRKRMDYDVDDYYSSRYDRHHATLRDDEKYDSDEVDSQCERDQRMESWINEGVFTAKRKKPMDHSSTTVPMSRPLSLNKSSHVFHEPAPKLPGTRSTKMLRKVNRHSQKATAVETNNKRISNEGMDSIKQIAQRQEKELGAIKHRLRLHLDGELDMYENDGVKWLKTLKKQMQSFTEMILQEDRPSLVALAQALVNNASTKFTQRLNTLRPLYRNPITVKDLLENILLSELQKINTKIISARENPRDKFSPSAPVSKNMQRVFAFREAELQIILRLEIAWCFVEPDDDVTQDLLTEIVSVLQIISVYRSNPPIDHFINTVLLPTYSQCNKFLRALYKKMNIALPPQLTIDGSPVQNSNRRDDDSSIISSTSSAMLYPEDSASQLNVHKRHRPSTSFKRSTAPTSSRKPTSGSKRVKRQIMVAHASNPRLSSSQYLMDRTDAHKNTTGVNQKASPKRVRRNLFDVQIKDRKDSKTLLTLGSSSRLTKSPVFKSPKGKSPLSPSGFFRAARSRKQLILNNQPADNRFGSPTLNADVLCPESPATPGCDRRSVASRYAATNASGGSGERQRVIQESPEVMKNDFDNRPMNRVASLSFYSSGCSAPKSRAWGKSEANLIAEKIKNSVDLRSSEMIPDDLTQSPYEKPSRNPSDSTDDTPCTRLSFCDDSYTEKNHSPMPLGSNSQSLLDITGPAPDLDNPNIAALINGPFFPLATTALDIPLKAVQNEPGKGNSPSFSNNIVASPNNLQTPSKRVQFNLNENLVNTPSSARRTSTGTPKSILKETHE
ncbi:hypothetical protein Ocin01_09821 [Orchesella cincta]|uniref:Treslin n=1 Tax=Orchesella cincta TaxID=48709 RepID=A0A1D2MUU2_ORCCI|nr:hypothetical protein Ocin01_09821 [Orchesella cincta]